MGQQIEICCQERAPVNDTKREVSYDDFKLKKTESMLTDNQSEYLTKSVVSTSDTTNSNIDKNTFENIKTLLSEAEQNLLEDPEYIKLMEKYKQIINEAKLLDD